MLLLQNIILKIITVMKVELIIAVQYEIAPPLTAKTANPILATLYSIILH